MVVIYHLVHAEHVHGRGESVLGGPAHFGFAGVDVFFVISGFIMATITAGRFGSIAGALDFLGRRALRIFPLYWLCSAVIVLALFVRPDSLDASFAEKSIVHSLLLWPQEGGPLLEVGWTLTYEMFFYAMTAIALAVSARSRIPRMIAGWAVALLVVQLLPAQAPWSKLLTSPLALEFMAGVIAALHWRRLSVSRAWLTISAGMIWMICAGICLADHPYYGQADRIRVLAFGLPSALLVTGLARLEVDGRIRPPQFAVLLGDASYSLYLTHLFVLSLSGRMWSSLGATGTTPGNIAFVISTFMACCATGLLVHKLVERPMTSFGNRVWQGASRPR